MSTTLNALLLWFLELPVVMFTTRTTTALPILQCPRISLHLSHTCLCILFWNSDIGCLQNNLIEDKISNYVCECLGAVLVFFYLKARFACRVSLFEMIPIVTVKITEGFFSKMFLHLPCSFIGVKSSIGSKATSTTHYAGGDSSVAPCMQKVSDSVPGVFRQNCERPLPETLKSHCHSV